MPADELDFNFPTHSFELELDEASQIKMGCLKTKTLYDIPSTEPKVTCSGCGEEVEPPLHLFALLPLP